MPEPSLRFCDPAIAVIVAVLMCLGCGRDNPGPSTVPASAPSDGEVPKPQFVGMGSCADCHADKVDSHEMSGHAATFATTADSPVARAFCGTSIDDAAPYGRFEYECDDEGLMVRLPGVFGDDRFPIQYALGSGRHAVTFLSLIPSASGQTVGIEHRWSWFADADRCGVTPGQGDLLPTQDVDFFGMVFTQEVLERCIGCHTTTAEIRDDALVNLQANVNCEACHGPAERHVELARTGSEGAAAAIEVHRPGAAEIALCGRCHRMPHEFDPDRLTRYPPSLVRFQPVGMLRSRCFTESDGAMSCSTCHDPHETSSSRTVAQYEVVCRNCHAAERMQTACPVSPGADCIRCHMPQLELADGLHFHDHWIRVRATGEDAASEPLESKSHAHAQPEPGQPD